MNKQTQRFSRIAVFLMLIGLLGGFPSFAQPANAQTPEADDSAATAIGTLSDRACPTIGPAGEREGDTYFCGLLTVPENYEKPDGRQIQISYAVLKSFSHSPLPDPVVYLDGGPGGSSLQSIAGLAGIFEGPRQYRDVILFDQRGNKYSNRLNCDPYRFSFNYLLETDEEFQELYAEIQELTDAEALPSTILQIIYQACADGLTEAGNDLTQYNSANSVKDIFELTNALGYDEINLLGISYGTRLALTAMRDHPDQIRSVIIDSVYPPEVNGIEWFPRQADEQINRIVETCEQDRECNRAFPDFRENLLAISESLQQNNPNSLFGLYALFNAVNTFPELAEYLPIIIEEIISGEGTPVLDAIQAGDLPAEDLSEDQPGQADEIMLQAQDLEQTAESLFLMAAMQEQAQRPGAIWMKKVGEVMAPLSREENGEAAIALLSLLIYYPEPDVENLKGFVTEFLPEEVHEELLADLDQLDGSEVQYVYDLINDLSDDLSDDSGGFTQGMYYSVECQEEAPFNDVEVARASIEELNFPALAGIALATAEEIATVCDVWPSAEPDPIETEPVVSDIPTLILVGDWDTQTPASWGAPLLEGLSNAILVEAPASGHGVMLDSKCSYDIMLAFLVSPGAELRLDCIGDLRPDFVTVSEARAQLAEINGEDEAIDEEADDEQVDDTGSEDETTDEAEDEPSGSEEDDDGGGEDRPVSGR